MLSIHRPFTAPVERPRFGNAQAESLKKRQQVFTKLEERVDEAIDTLWNGKGNSETDMSGHIALSGILQAYATMAGYMLNPGKPGPMPE